METKHKISLFVVSVLLGSMLTVGFSTVHQPKKVTADSGDYLQLSADLTKENERHDFFQSQIEKLQSQIADYKAKQGDRKELASAMADELDKVKKLAGVSEIKGNGIIITINDSFDAVADGGGNSPEAQLELGPFLSETVNYLFGNGAQAVAVDNHRITSISSIRSVSENNLQVNSVMIDPRNITIRAVGNIDQMKIGMNQFPDAFLQLGKEFKITEVKNGSLVIPPYELPVNFKYAEPEGDKNL